MNYRMGSHFYNTGFRTTLEALVEEGVTFPKEFGYIKSDSIKYPIIKNWRLKINFYLTELSIDKHNLQNYNLW